jgi:hypothetical protein
MSKVFRRPMFRGGSTNMNGIMSGIEDRKNFQDGTTAERLQKIADQFPDQGISPLNQFLIQGGLNLMSQPSTGSTLGDIATAAKAPTAQLLKDLSARGQLKKKLALEGEVMDIEAERAERLAKIKNQNKDIFNSQLYETQVEKMRDNLVKAAGDRIVTKYKGSKADDIARKTTDFVMKAPKNIIYDLVEIDYIDVGEGKQSSFIPDLSKVQKGQIFYDASMGQWKKRVSEGNGKLDFVTLDPYNNYQPVDIDQN